MKRWPLRLALLCSALLLVSPPAYADVNPKDLSPAESTLVQAYDLILNQHYDTLDEQKLVDAAIDGMIKSLNDPYAVHMSPAEWEAFAGSINGEYGGIGVTLNPSGDGVELIRVFPGSPAAKAGLQVGDRILAVDDQPTTDKGAQAVASLLVGKVGTKVRLLVQRGAAEPARYELERAVIDLPTVEGRTLDDGVAYITIHSFGERTSEEFSQVLAAQKADQAKGLVIDLRGNGGGYVISAVTIADHFLASGTIVTLANLEGPVAIEADPEASTVPLVVLVDQSTASASEILAGALQKSGRARLVGVRSFGKGVAQSNFPLADGSNLKFTTDHWFLPDGSSINKVGLTPDLVITASELRADAAIRLLDPHWAIKTAVEPLRVNGSAYVPLRYVLEALGAQVNWSAEAGVVTSTVLGQKLWAKPDEGLLKLNGTTVSGEQVLLLQGDRTYVKASVLTQLPGVSLSETDAKLLLQTK